MIYTRTIIMYTYIWSIVAIFVYDYDHLYVCVCIYIYTYIHDVCIHAAISMCAYCKNKLLGNALAPSALSTLEI